MTIIRLDDQVRTIEMDDLARPLRVDDMTRPVRGDNLASLEFIGYVLLGAPVFYVSTSGNDSNDGRTPATAWATLAKVNATTFNRGEQVLFKGGDTFAGKLILSAPSVLSVGDPVVYGSYGSGRPVIAPVANGDTGLFAVNPRDITIRDLHLVGTGIATSTMPGVWLQVTLPGDVKLTGVKLINLEVEQFGDSGITVTGENGSSGFDGLEIDGCLVHHCTGNTTAGYGNGIYVWGNYGLVANAPTHTYTHIHHCVVHTCTGTLAVTTGHTGSGILVEEGADTLIEWCVAYNNGENSNWAGGGPVGIWTFDSLRTVIQYCVSHSNKSNTIDGGGFDLDGGCVDCVIQYCYSQGNEGNGYLLYVYDDATVPNNSGNIIRYNISENDGTVGPTTHGGIVIGCMKNTDQSGNLIYGNTIYSSVASSNAVLFVNSTYNNRFVNGRLANNILFVSGTSARLIATAGTVTPPASFAIEGNLYWTPNTFNFKWGATSYTSIAAWKTASSKEQLGPPVSANPMLVGILPVGPISSFDPVALAPYKTQVGSPARNAGVNLTSLYGIDPPQDLFGNPVPDVGADSRFDIGCFESDGYSVAQLNTFMAGQADGVWFDFKKLDRHFQEANGSTPSDGTGEAMGLSLDQRLWSGYTLSEVLASAPELILNGQFTTNTTNWSAASSAVLSAVAGNLRITNGAASEGGAQQAVTTVAGDLFKLTVDGRSGTTASANVAMEVQGTVSFPRVGFTKNTQMNRFLVAAGTSVTIYPRTNSSTINEYAEFDNFSLKKIPGHCATQTTTSARPAFQASGVKFDGSDDNLLTNYFASAGANFIVAKITVPATLSGLQIFAGASGASANRIYLAINSVGQLCAGVGGQVATVIVGTQDLRGQEVVVGLTMNGSTVKLFVNGVEEYSGAQVATPTTTIPFRIGCLNNNGTAANFFAGSVKEILMGREYLTLDQYLKIRGALAA